MRAGSLGFWTAASTAITNNGQTVSGPTIPVLLDFIDSDAEVSVVIVFFANGSTTYETTTETLAKSHHSLGMRPQQDYTHRVMLNNCVHVC